MSAERLDSICTAVTIGAAMVIYLSANQLLANLGVGDYLMIVGWFVAVGVFSAYTSDARARLRGEK